MAKLAELLQKHRCVMAPGVYDALSARIAAAAGFEALALSGYSFEAAHFALPDLGFAGLSDTAEAAARITRAVSVPLIVDADTGYGGPANVRNTVHRLEQAGAAAMHIEDQADPKKCGGLPGRQVIPCDAMVEKVKAALAARSSRDFLIIARTDAKSSNGLEDAANRLNAYLDAGADVAFFAESYTRDELAFLGKTVKGPLAICAGIPGWPASLEPVDAYADLSVRLVLYPFSSLYVATRAMQEGYAAMRSGKGIGPAFAADRMMTFDAFSRFIGVDDWSK